jgi:hypothetical protein
MEKRIPKIEVPANRSRELHIPELIGTDIANILVTADGHPQRISTTNTEGRFRVDFTSAEPGQCVDLVISRNKPVTHEISVRGRDILSISVSDMTALRVLPLIGEREFSSYTGAQFGLFLSILLATGLKAPQLIQAFTAFGLKMFHIRIFEKRNSFTALENFCRKMIPNVDNMSVKELEADIFIPVVNGATGKQGFITRETTPDLPLLSAIKCAVATLMDYVPLRTGGEAVGSEDAFLDSGLIWGYSTFSFSCPDLTLYHYLNSKNLSFTTYASYPELSPKHPKQIKNHKEMASHFQVDEIAKRIHLEEVASIMPELVSSYDLTLLEPLPVLNYASHNQIRLLVNGV